MVMPRMKNVVSAMAENYGGDDVEKKTNGSNDEDELRTFNS